MPGNSVQAGSRRDTVGSVSDDDTKMVICEEGTAEGNSDTSVSKAGKYGEASGGLPTQVTHTFIGSFIRGNFFLRYL